MPTVTFNANYPTVIQTTDYGCSIGSLCWCLNSIGVGVDQDALAAIMVPAFVSTQVGLLDGSGAGLVSLLTQRWGLAAANQSRISFDGVCALAGQRPLVIGGHNWSLTGVGHWVGVRGVDGNGLILANPAGTSHVYGQPQLTRDDFDQRGPFSAVWIVDGTVSGAGGGGVSATAGPASGRVVPLSGDYIVRPGDTLAAIAQASGCGLADLLNLNSRITDPNLINVGETIHLPQPPPAQTYTVQSGDTLSAIANRLGVDILALERANPQISDPSLISIGEVLTVPNSA